MSSAMSAHLILVCMPIAIHTAPGLIDYGRLYHVHTVLTNSVSFRVLAPSAYRAYLGKL